MSLRKMMMFVGALMFLLPVSKVVAMEGLTCSDIEWSSAVTDRYPGIKDACYDVIQSNGNVLAKVRVKIIDMNSDDISFRFVQSDDTLSDVYQIASSPDWTDTIRGARLESGTYKKYGMTMDAYVPNNHWAVIGEGGTGPNLAEATGPIEVRGSVAESEPTDEVRSVAVMPDTAGPLLPLIGLLAAGLIALGGGIRLFLRRIR